MLNPDRLVGKDVEVEKKVINELISWLNKHKKQVEKDTVMESVLNFYHDMINSL